MMIMWNSKKYLAMAVVGAGLAVAAATPASAQFFGGGWGGGWGGGSGWGGFGYGAGYGDVINNNNVFFPGGGLFPPTGGIWPGRVSMQYPYPYPYPQQQPQIIVLRVGGGPAYGSAYGCAPRPTFGCMPRASAYGCGSFGRAILIPHREAALRRFYAVAFHHVGHVYAGLRHGHVYASYQGLRHHYAAHHGYSLKLAA
jgi:hypothetical protein